jgi:hypothetical protein
MTVAQSMQSFKPVSQATEGDNRCQVPILLRNYTVWSDCEERARMVHPKGFRSLFG